MNNIIKSSLFKLTKDLTFRITLIIGAALAIFLNLLNFGLDALVDLSSHTFCNAPSMLISSLSPAQNFGIAVPINLAVFTVNEFNHGTIRNKIIAGHKKSEIYISLLLIGLIFTFSLMIVYSAISTLFAGILSGFAYIDTACDPTLIVQYLLQAICVYIFITTLSIFFATLFRSVGPTLPILIVLILFCFFAGFLSQISTLFAEDTESIQLVSNMATWIDPLYTFGIFSLFIPDNIDTNWFIASIITPLYWATIFGFSGLLIFIKRDVK